MDEVPAFGQANLTNCEREPIHLAGSVQPHGALLLLAEGSLAVLQASTNTASVLGVDAASLLGQPLTHLGGDVASRVMDALQALGNEPLPLAVRMGKRIGDEPAPRLLEATLHRPPGGGLVLELEPRDAEALVPTPLEGEQGATTLADAVRRMTGCASIQTLADTLVKLAREITGYDRVMVYRFDADEHGQVIAEACGPRVDAFLGHHYPASDIPPQARALYLRNRVRVLVDVDAAVQPLTPALRPDNGQPLDMSLCQLRSMSPMHLQYLRNMGVTASMSLSLVRDGRLWGLLAAHHHSPRQLGAAARSALDLLSEVASTRIAAIENYAHAQVALLVRRLEQRLIEATSTEGDWRQALLRNPRALLQAFGATGAALFHEDEVLTAGEAPSTPELRDLLRWVDTQHAAGGGGDTTFAHSAVAKAHPLLCTLAPTACGVLAVKLSSSRPDYLMWFRKEQLLTMTWAGDPAKPMVDDDPTQLSPRRSFAAWSEIVRGTAPPWALSDRLMARAVGSALVDIIVQVHAVRLLIAESQLEQIRRTVGAAAEPVLLTRPDGRLIFANEAFEALRGGQPARPSSLTGTPVASLFTEPAQVQKVLDQLSHQPWRGEWAVAPHQPGGVPRQVSVRAERVPGRDGLVMGCMIALTDLSDLRRTAQARHQLEASLTRFGGGSQPAQQTDPVVGAILTNASIAAMDIADGNTGSNGTSGPTVAPLLEELESSARRATTLYAQLLRIRGEPPVR